MELTENPFIAQARVQKREFQVINSTGLRTIRNCQHKNFGCFNKGLLCIVQVPLV